MGKSVRVRLTEVLYYRTAKLVEIRNWKLGLFHRGIQVAIIAYIVGYVIVFNQGYQSQSTMVSSFVSKVKGNSYANVNGTLRVIDAYDLVQPPLEQDALFVALRLATTHHQERGVCPGNYVPLPDADDSQSELCNSTYGCAALRETWNGVTEGTCHTATGFCNLYAWCPPEPPDAQLQYATPIGVENVTIFIKCNVAFTDFGIVIDNVGRAAPVMFDPANPTARNASIWTVGQMLHLASAGASKPIALPDLQKYGAVIAVNFEYACNFNTGTECLPTAKFSRIDDPTSKSAGFNYRRAVAYHGADGAELRDLTKLVGLRFVFQISGFGKKFVSPVPALTQLGAGVALVAIATLVADLLVEYVLPHKTRYVGAKVKMLDDPDDAEAVASAAMEVNGERKPLLSM